MFNEERRDSLYHLFSQIIRLHFMRVHAHLEKIGLYPGQHPVLFILKHHKEGLSQRELADHMKIKPATITVMLKRLENAQVVTRRPDPVDQRITRVYLTEKGLALTGEMEQALMEIDRELFSHITVEEQALLRRLFMQMRDNLIEANKKSGDEARC
ncbi:MarR family winged helix-turn-helix transcriptional regulator [Gorillibacterium timonense]|uniref:MarR family winged helix-turn-helix transcriptional regulator n=1 Tax=Gorillibacterium timonense TaxID=1689269 RepID=UPI00071C781B|nr:MarR family transcriptional regulator [Gorillibacterium timonense]